MLRAAGPSQAPWRACQSTARYTKRRSIQTLSRPAPYTSTLSRSPFLPRLSTSSAPFRTTAPLHSTRIQSHARAFSLWPKSSTPAPIIGEDGKLQAASSVATPSSSPSTSIPVDFQAPPPDHTKITSSTASTSSTLDSASSNTSPHSLHSLPTEVAESIAETEKTLQDYGLGGGGFIGRTQELLEWTHLTTGLPWWATIGSVVIGVRLFLFPIMVKGIANNARLAHIQPTMMRNIAKIKKAKEEGNMAEMQTLQLQTKQLFIDHNCGPLRGLIPPLVQMPLFIIFFLSLRGMATAGLPDFATGGLAWFTDLSAPDPYYILPALSSAATLAVLQVGEYGQPEAQGMAKGIRSAIKLCTPLIFWFTSYFPAAVLMYWVTHNSFSVLQTLILRLPGFKRWANIPDPPPRPAPSSKPDEPTGFFKAIRDTTDAFSDTMEQAKERTAKSMAEKEAQKEAKKVADAIAERKKAALANAKATESSVDALVESVSPVNHADNANAVEERRNRVSAARKRKETHRHQKRH